MERLQKVLAHCGVASRRECEEIIEQGRVEVNGKVITKLGTKIDPEADEIKVDGERVKREQRVYYLLNKPRGYICTNADERGRPRVVDLIKESRRIYCVGRLDEDSEGLLLVTNDGQVTNVVCHPRYQIYKTYRLNVKGRVDPRSLEKIEAGVWLAGGKTAPAQVRRVERRGTRTLVTISLWEGRNRELRRMFAKVGLRVASLVRTSIGPLRADGIDVGAYRRLLPNELGFVLDRLKDDWKPAAADKPEPTRWRDRLADDTHESQPDRGARGDNPRRGEGRHSRRTSNQQGRGGRATQDRYSQSGGTAGQARPPRDPSSRGPDSRGPGARGPGSRGPDSRGPGSRGPGSRGPGARGPGSRGPGSRGPGRGPGRDGPGRSRG